MEVQISTKPAFTVIGIEGSGDADKGPEWIRPLWSQASERFIEVKDLVRPDLGAWGLMSATDEYLAPWKKDGKYLAGWEAKSGTRPPKGWTMWNVPARTYAVIACTFTTYGEAYLFTLQQFFPKENYEQAGAMHEFYPIEFKDPGKDTLHLYLPIKKR
jgi:predicted transcriptional regulator YdeE